MRRDTLFGPREFVMSSNATVNASTIDLARNPASIVGAAQAQWFKRPDDHKFESVDKLFTAVADRRRRSTAFDVPTNAMHYAVDPKHGLYVQPTGKGLPQSPLFPTHYAFGQAALATGFSAGELRKLHDQPALVAGVLNHMRSKAPATAVKLMATDDRSGSHTRMQALTSPTYGRIWDADVVQAARQLLERTHGRFEAPLDWSKKKRALFASDRDVFMFFCDGGSIVDGGSERDQLHRGFFMWNSEVGARTMGIATFMFRAVCGNFGIWGSEDVRMLKIRHTSGGPERFVTDAVPALEFFTQMSAKPIEQQVKKAKAYLLPKEEKEFDTFFLSRNFTRQEIRRATDLANTEEGQAVTLWDLYNGFTAAARFVPHVDAKIDLETRAGALMKLVAA